VSHLPGLFVSPAQMSTAITTAVSGVPVGELPAQVHLDIAAAIQALPAGSTPAQVQAAISTALAGQPVGELPAQVHADIAAAVAALPVGATSAQVTAAITSATSGLADGTTIAMVGGKLSVIGAPAAPLVGAILATDTPLILRGTTALTATQAQYQAWVGSSASAAPAETLTVTTPSAQTAGTAFVLNGTYTNGPPPALDWSLNGTAGPWTASAGVAPSGGAFAIPGIVISAANATQTITVRDRGAQSIVATSGAFAVSAAVLCSNRH